MEIKFNCPNKSLSSNKSTRLKHSFLTVLPTTIKNYFIWNYENIYFLMIAIFQLSTISLLPKEWSPTGPYGTAIPLFLCIVLEIITAYVQYYRDLMYDKQENNKEFSTANKQKIKNKDIYPGVILYLEKDDICPVDGILLDTSNNEKFSKISLALLTGESNLHYVVKPNKYYKLSDYNDAELTIINYYQDDFHNLEGTIKSTNGFDNVEGDSFIVAGSIIKSDDVYILVTACGKDKKSYLQYKKKEKENTLDKFVGMYMININAQLLGLLVFCVTIFKMYYYSFSLFNFVIFSIQNWILFNGIIPFSIKISLLFARNTQTKINNAKSNITINTASQIDDMPKIRKILSDKTGTITKNELEFTNLISAYRNTIISVDNKIDKTDISLEFNKCLGLCIHQNEDKYSTEEDKTIRYRYQYLNNKISQKGNEITLIINNTKYPFKYVDMGGLDFTFERKMSSKIVRHNDKYYIYCKGSLDIIYNKLQQDHKPEFKRIDNLISSQNPELRLLACAFREISKEELELAIKDSLNQSKMVSSLENKLVFLGIIGIKDNLQPDIKKTIQHLDKDFKIPTCLLTGDRKITALAIAKEAGALTVDYIDYDPDNILNMNNLNKKTFVFSGKMLDCNIDNYLLTCKNFIGYNLIPEHKKRIARLFQKNHIKVLAIGDGYNDIGMFNISSISVAVKGNEYVESHSDFVIKEFKDLSQLFDFSINTNIKNTNFVNFSFYKCSAIIFTLLTYLLMNYKNDKMSLFGGFVLQGFNFAWLSIGSIYSLLASDKESFTTIENNLTVFNTSIWNVSGILTGITTLLLGFYYINSAYFADIIGLILITLLNIKQLYKINKFTVISAILGVFNFILYTVYIGSFNRMVVDMFNIPFMFWILLIGFYNLFSFFLI